MNRKLVTIEVDGTSYTGEYALEDDSVIVKAPGFGHSEIDASLVDYSLGEPTRKLAKLVLRQLVKDKLAEPDDLSHLCDQTTTQMTFSSSV